MYHVAVIYTTVCFHDYDTCGKQGRTTIIK